MNSLHVEILNEMMLLCGQSMFTVYDVRRILEHKTGEKFSHDDVREWVEFYYKQVGLRREIGYQLPYSPPPQIYYTKGQDINKYDPDALDPLNAYEVKVTAKQAKAAIMPAQSRTVKVVAVPVQTEYLYALVDKKTGKRIRPCKGNSIGLYKTRNGPMQLQWPGKKKDYEVIKYEVILKPVDN